MHWSRISITNPKIIAVADPLSSHCAINYVQEVMAVNPLRPMQDRIQRNEQSITNAKASLHKENIRNTPRKRQVSEYDSFVDAACKKVRSEDNTDHLPPNNLDSDSTQLEKLICDMGSNVEKKFTTKFNTVITDRIKGEVSKVRDEIRGIEKQLFEIRFKLY